MTEISKNNTGLSGEYFVAAELYRRGWSIGMTIGNAKAVDLYAEKDNKTVSIQVKSMYKNHGSWPIMTSNIKENCFYVFVNLNSDKMGQPDYYICTAEEAKSKIKDYETRGVLYLASLNSEEFKGNWGKLEG